MSSLKYVAGIDFGTTNSAISVSGGGVPRMVRIDPNCDTIPTALFFDESSRRVFIGHDAYEKYREPFSEGRLMRSLKRILGTSTMPTGTQIYGKYTKFEDVIGYFIQHSRKYGMTACVWDNGVAEPSKTESEKYGYYNRLRQEWYFPLLMDVALKASSIGN